jgi:integrase
MREIAKARNTKISTEVEKATAGRNLSKSQIKKIKEGICLRYETRGRVAANRWLAALRSCFSGAIAEGIVSTNPAMAVNLNDENPPRDRVLSDSELKLLLQAAEEEDPHNRAAIRLAIETGARRSEILRARWEDMNLDEGLWRIPSPKAGKPQVIPLASGTVHWLATLPRLGPYVIAGRDPTQPRFDIKSVWIRVCKKAELTDITFHDLRRTFGKRVERQFGVHVASKLLRHSDVRITSEIYAPFDIEELRAATEDGQRALENVVSIRDARAPVVKRQSSG